MTLRILLLSALVALAGCSSSLFEGKKIDYKSAGKLAPLEIPPDLTAPSREDRFTIPEVNSKGTATFSAYNAERSGLSKGGSADVLPLLDSKVRVERAGSQRWLVVPGTPEKVWPQVKEFWQETGFLINLEIAEAGLMETDWAENRAKIPQGGLRDILGKVLDNLYSVPERDKFRTRLERGTEPNTTEIYISHRGMVEIYRSEAKTETVWQPRPADPELETEMLKRLMVRFGTDEARAKSELAIVKAPDRAQLVSAQDGSRTLKVEDAFDRTWRRVGLALDRVGFTVEDRDRSKGFYYVRYVDPQIDNATKKSDDGMLSKLMFWRGSKNDPKKNSEQYRIYIKSAAAERSEVQVLSKEGGVDKSDSARKILTLLQEQLK